MKIIGVALLGVLLSSIACNAHESEKFDGRAWKVGNDASDDREHVVEYVLPGQTVDQWKELVTHQVMFDPQHKADIPRLLDTMKAQLSAGCPSLSWTVLSQSATAATYEWSHETCGGYPPQYEISTLSICSEAVCRWAYSTKLVPAPASVREEWLRLLPTLPMGADSSGDMRSLTLATGDSLEHLFKDGIPTPASSKWATVRGAGPTIGPEGDGYRLSWVVDLRPKEGSKGLPKIGKAAVEEVSGKTVVSLFDGPVHDQDDGGVMIIAPAGMVTRSTYAWLYTAEPTLLIFRVTLTAADGETDVLLQPVLIGVEVKNQLKSRGYVR
jgi:hypothetical protein